MVEVGETVWRTPVGFHEMIGPGHQTKQRFKGRVIYVHPDGRYHRVVFDLPGGRVIEAFPGAEREEVVTSDG